MFKHHFDHILKCDRTQYLRIRFENKNCADIAIFYIITTEIFHDTEILFKINLLR